MRLSPNRLAMAAAIAALPILAFVFGWLRDDPLPPRVVRGLPASAEWSLPRAIERDFAAEVNVLASRRPFGASTGPAAAAPSTGAGAVTAGAGTGSASPPVQWRLGGIVIAGTSASVIILSRSTPQTAERSELRTVGDALPDGSVVQSIDLGSISINREGMLATRRMFARD